MQKNAIQQESLEMAAPESLRLKASVLVADVGGTSVRFGLVSELCEGKPRIEFERVFSCEQFETFDLCLQHYLSQADRPIQQACIAVAGPVSNGKVEMTNLKWKMSASSLSQCFKLEKVSIINDFVAQAMSTSLCEPSLLKCLHTGKFIDKGARVVMGPGTGLGVAGLIWSGEHWQAIQSEAGHVAFAAQSKLEQQICRFLQVEFDYVSVERLLSGPGLVNIYRALAAIYDQQANSYQPGDISRYAMQSTDEICVESLKVFVGILGACAADSALVFQAEGGVFLGGGVLGHISSTLPNRHFIDRFLANGIKQEFLKNVPVYLLDNIETGLQGAAVYATRGLDYE